MKQLAVIDESKDFLAKFAYNIIYGRKFKKLNIDKNLSDSLIDRRKDYYAKDILKLINKSKNRDEFSTNIIDYLKLKGRNAYANSLLIGNVTGKYNFNNFYYDSVKELNLDAFTKDNEDLIQDLKSHFVEYILSDNKYKNKFAERIQVGKSLIKDLSQDLNKEEVVKDFDRVLNGENTNDDCTKPGVVEKYLMKTIGVYTKEDIKENFDFVLYDIDRGDKNGIDERRRKYLLHSNLSNNQLRKIEEAKVLKLRLQKINGEVSEQLISRLNNIENNFDIAVLEGGGSPAEINLREYDLVNMGMAELVDSPVILVGNIDIGGVFASIYGTVMLLDENDRKRIKGYIINKFRGDSDLLKPAIEILDKRFKDEGLDIKFLGVLPYADLKIEEEDSLSDGDKRVYSDDKKYINISVIKIKKMSNFTDFHAFKQYDDVRVRYIDDVKDLGEEDIIIFPGSKNTITDLEDLKERGIFEKVKELKEKLPE